MSVRIGCDHLVYSVMTTEETATEAPTYAEVIAAEGVMSVNINPNASMETLFADDGPMETATTLGNIEVEIQKAYLSTKNKADLLGHVIDSNGALVSAANDTPPWVAVGFRTLKSNGKYRYIWLYKGRFMDPEDNNETKGDTINFQNDTISGQFAKLQKPYKIGGKDRYPWKYEIDEDDEGIKEAVVTAWFTKVTMPSETAPASMALKI